MNPMCECGHVLDEHADMPSAPCTVCACIGFDAAEEPPDEPKED